MTVKAKTSCKKHQNKHLYYRKTPSRGMILKQVIPSIFLSTVTLAFNSLKSVLNNLI
uniref:RNA recognition motif-containing protein n=1 Tax=Solanum tuberosum TaxID=4113 RepID=M1CJV8_SOLTU